MHSTWIPKWAPAQSHSRLPDSLHVLPVEEYPPQRCWYQAMYGCINHGRTSSYQRVLCLCHRIECIDCLWYRRGEIFHPTSESCSITTSSGWNEPSKGSPGDGGGGGNEEREARQRHEQGGRLASGTSAELRFHFIPMKPWLASGSWSTLVIHALSCLCQSRSWQLRDSSVLFIA